ncbi:MAG: transporter substrate-binding domain-containing protein [Lachnospiraceae bacterium]|nr:transporter substrate-binding domain-containing protein [Lachnospiraceae bacterium]
MKRKYIFILLLIMSIFVMETAGCLSKPNESDFNIVRISSFREVPGITAEEIAAIEELQLSHRSFSYGIMSTTESFILDNGTHSGYAALFCDLLTSLFEIPFIPQNMPWSEIIDGLEAQALDFTGDMTPTAERHERYFMTVPIAQRTLGVFTYDNNVILETEQDLNGLTIGIREGSSIPDAIRKAYPNIDFELYSFTSAVNEIDLLRDGIVDVYISDAVVAHRYIYDPLVRVQELLPLVYGPVSLTTSNEKLKPVITVMDKYINAGGIHYLYELYREGKFDYGKFVLNKSFTSDEKDYLDNLNGSIPVFIHTGNYPLSFYNRNDGEYQGMAVEILTEISKLIDIEFEAVNNDEASWSELVDMLRDGEAAMITVLFKTNERSENFMWSENSYYSSRYVFMSKQDYPYLEMYQVPHVRVGIVSGAPYEELYNNWFPGSNNVTIYSAVEEAFDALERGDIDLYFGAEYLLLYQNNYREKPGYKTNLAFSMSADSYFGFYEDEELLRSIINKAMDYVEAEKISNGWVGRVYDYSRDVAQARFYYMMAIIGFLLLVMIIIISVSFQMSYRRKAHANQQVLEIQRQSAQAASDAKTHFLANMSHEIRTPMNAIIGMSDLLLSEELNVRQHRFVEDIKISSLALLDIINDILDLSKIQTAKLYLSPVHYNFKALIEHVKSMIEFLISSKGKELVFEMDIQNEIPDCLYGDDVRLRQILLNILSNAVKFTKVGSIIMTVRIIDDNMQITVSDTGTGIPEEDIPSLFDAFEQADKQKNRHQQGTGLGLAITKSLVDLMGGHILVKSMYGIGSSFQLFLPFYRGDESLINDDTTNNEIVYAPDAKVLVVDDRETNLSVICGLLHQCQIVNDTALSGETAIEMIKEKEYHLIFMDQMMPKMDGIEATKILREMGVKLPIIALTANAVSGAKELLLSSGMDDFLSKPIEKSELYRILRTWLPAGTITGSSVSLEKEAIPLMDENEAPFWQKIFSIKGLSAEVGLDIVSNQYGTYKNTLEISVREIEKSLASLKQYLEEENMRKFCIDVHGVKGSLALLGAAGLSAKAQKLENASRDGDISFCNENLPELLAGLTGLCNDLKDAFAELYKAQDKLEVPPELLPVLDRIMAAMIATDISVLYDELEKLDVLELKGQLKEEVENLKEAAFIMNQDHVAAIIERLKSDAE